MKPYIVRPVEPGMADVFDRATTRKIGWLMHWSNDWRAQCSVPWCWDALHSHRTAAAEALWRHYLDEHKEP